jgi:hypothetical protein
MESKKIAIHKLCCHIILGIDFAKKKLYPD